ncbi:MAG: dihydrofolate synthase / folylpolyglutamate synthase [Tepidanaerobacteraceae bacterium]|nr:dihydrofolate synthase / folylpolyglutamate synthase [Tepidanaerobacteraceae bacterium]
MASYKEALEYIHGLNRFGAKLGLENITHLLDILGNPHQGVKIIHVAGTNGKGSTCAMLDSILREAGYKVGLYTSPYLEVFNERIRINGQNISDDDIARVTQKVRDAISIMLQKNLNHPTEFEVVTAIGFVYFKEQAVDFIVLEVGMGGRLDATNVALPLVSVITPISFDHQQYLGNTLGDISREKCGIIKPGVPVVSGPQEQEALQVIRKTCIELGCPLTLVAGKHVDFDIRAEQLIKYTSLQNSVSGQIFNVYTPKNDYKNLKINLLGDHQLENAATAVGAIEALELSGIKIPRKAIYSGLEKARWPGRLEILREKPIVLIDGAHNIAGIKMLKKAILKYFPQKRKILVLGILGDKDYRNMIGEIAPIADEIITTAPDNPRALSAKALAEAVKESCASIDGKKIRVSEKNEIREAVDLALDLASPEDVIVFAGSLYMIGTVRTIFMRH